MSFLDTLTFGIISGEAAALLEMRKAAVGWYNELTKPLLPILKPKLEDIGALSVARRKQLKDAAEALYVEHRIENCGDELDHKMAELMHSHGIPWFSGRFALIQKTSGYIASGLFLKEIAYSSLDSEDPKVQRAALSKARTQHAVFERRKEALVKQINLQRGRIGYQK